MRYIESVAAPYTGDRKGVMVMPVVASFAISLLASVVAYYICKWLDGDDGSN